MEVMTPKLKQPVDLEAVDAGLTRGYIDYIISKVVSATLGGVTGSYRTF